MPPIARWPDACALGYSAYDNATFAPYSKVSETALVVLEVGPGLLSRYHSWKFQVAPGSTTWPSGSSSRPTLTRMKSPDPVL